VVVVVGVAAGVLLSLEPWVEKMEPASMDRMAYPLPDKPSIAVLPFSNLSDDPEQEYFADGMTEDLITDLSKLSGLFVISRTSTFTYKGRAVKVGQVAEELGVRYVLEGSVRRAGAEVRINAQLIDAMTGAHMWAERYDREYTDIFGLQDEVIGEIVAALKLNLTESEWATLDQRPTDNMEAYEHLLRGYDAHNRGNRDGNLEAREWFEKAIALDPSFAAAYELLGFTYYVAFAFQWEHGQDLLVRAFELAEKALALEPNAFGATMLRSHVYLWRRQFDLAIAEAEAALALNPNDADGYSGLGETLTWAGRPEEAVGWIRQAMRLNPEYPIFYSWNLGHAYWLTGRTEDAIALMEEVIARNPDWPPAHGYLVAMYGELGQMEKALAAFAELTRVSPEISVEGTRQTLPYKNPAHLERFLDGVRKVVASVKTNPAK
jgi:adenylate cyclase